MRKRQNSRVGRIIGVGTFALMLLGARNMNAQIIRGPYLQRVADSEITIRWRSSFSHTGTVFFGSSEGALTNSCSEPQADTNHVARLTGLNSGTTYFYQINDDTTVLATGPSYFFKTAPATGSSIPHRIWVLGDSGSANSDALSVYEAYQTYNGSDYTDLLLMLGDNAYTSGTDAQYQAAVFDLYPEILRQTPWFSCFSNHDAYSADSTTQTGPYYEILTLPAAGECGGVASGTEAYYSFDYGNIHFICLDSMDSPRATNGVQYAWLEQDLSANTSDWLIAFWHHPPYSKGSHDSDNSDGSDDELVDMRENFLPLLETHGVDLVLSGHSHLYERSYLLHEHYGFSDSFHPQAHALNAGDGAESGDGVYEKTSSGTNAGDGAVYVVAGSSGKATSIQSDFPHPVMVTSLVELGSVVIDVAGRRLDIRFLDSTGAVADAFTILKLDIVAGDSDGDGMPDEWEGFYFGDPTNAVAEIDSDGDGLDNLSEYSAGTNPQDSASVMKLDIVAQTNGAMVINWPSATFRNYDVLRSTNLLSNEWEIVSSNLSATAPVNQAIVSTDTNNAFYRIEVDYP